MDRRLLELFLIEIDSQCLFALIAWDDAVRSLEGGSHDRVWYSLQSFLVAAANVSKLLWPPIRSESNRGDEVRRVLDMKGSSPLESRDLRNCFEHFDERLETWAKAHLDGAFIDRNIFVGVALGIVPQEMALRNLEVPSWTVTFGGKRYSLPPIVAAIGDLRGSVRLALARLEQEALRQYQ